MMGITWRDDGTMFKEMEKAYLFVGKAALTWNHYDLAEKTNGKFTIDQWKTFLMDKRVA